MCALDLSYATFATNSTTYLDFFSQANLLDSSWTDLRDATPNYFSIEGHADASRYWYMNAAYGGCEVDNGWWVVGGSFDDTFTSSIVVRPHLLPHSMLQTAALEFQGS